MSPSVWAGPTPTWLTQGPRLPTPEAGWGPQSKCRLSPPTVGQLSLPGGARFLVQASIFQLKAALAQGTLDGIWGHLWLSQLGGSWH